MFIMVRLKSCSISLLSLSFSPTLSLSLSLFLSTLSLSLSSLSLSLPLFPSLSLSHSNFSVAKKIVADNPPPVNINLNSNLYILFGRRTGDSNAGSLRIHSETPKISARRYNPTVDSERGQASSFPKIPLIRAHGILMLIAWPLLGATGIFFAAWMRPAMPNGQWFQVRAIELLIKLHSNINDHELIVIHG